MAPKSKSFTARMRQQAALAQSKVNTAGAKAYKNALAQSRPTRYACGRARTARGAYMPVGPRNSRRGPIPSRDEAGPSDPDRYKQAAPSNAIDRTKGKERYKEVMRRILGRKRKPSRKAISNASSG